MTQSNVIIETKRLRLVPMTYDFVRKIIGHDHSAYELLGAVRTDTWPEKADIKDILPMILGNLADHPVPDGFDAWLFISKENHSVVGDGGFKGAPDEHGVIDIGYAIIEAQREKGYASEAVPALLEWGLAQHGVNAVTADCLEDNLPSIKVLSKLGMQEIDRREGCIFYRTF
ncbi:GNAT family N-acetyltransferase [Paenibacillus borealis]|uniref:N-acetyltransferase domain-containing protein n=1 Tax=Paenibacillus borealis TaxID=160799 RepID=A0A089LGT0_PAEBO|nr:GNAT family N-acetyltransferase [Paenibacillus borealis]AIQ60082.1 hypothetical protein PBOR_26370 [Paenibacillus borealis]